MWNSSPEPLGVWMIFLVVLGLADFLAAGGLPGVFLAGLIFSRVLTTLASNLVDSTLARP